ncbi:MAG TPA: thioredoxin family protein [Niastella sp.]
MKYITLSLSILLISCFGKKPEITGQEGKPLPSFNILLSDSVTNLDTKDIPGNKPVALLLFGPHCPYSKAQVEEIVSNINTLKNIQFYLFTERPFAQMIEFYQAHHLNNYSNIKVGVDAKDFFGRYMGARGVPYMAIYDRNKLLIKAFTGKLEASQIKEVAESAE